MHAHTLPALIKSLNDRHSPLFWIRFVPSAAILGYVIWRWVTVRGSRPSFTEADILYQEYFASGRSQKNVLTRFGGASRCLRLVVTPDFLWVTSWFPFSLFGALSDLEHVIPLRSIRSVENKPSFGIQGLLLTYTDDQGCGHALRLVPKDQGKFLAAIQAPANSRGLPSSTWDVQPAAPPLSIAGALRKYWHHLIGVALFPPLVLLGASHFHIPLAVIAPVFFAVMIYGMWPAISGRTTFSYQFAFGAAWMGGGILAVILAVLFSLVRSLLAGHPG